MSLKKISCLCAALLLIVGMSSVVNAAAPQGVRLRIDHPANGTWAGIGDSVMVRVQFLPGTAALDSVVIAIASDTSTTTVALLIASLANDGADDFVRKFGATDAKAADSDGFKSFSATFKVTAGQTVESSSKTLVLQALVSTNLLVDIAPLNNQNPDETIAGSTSFGKVGDLSKIGIDAQRSTASITTVRLDTAGVSDFPSDLGGPGANGKNPSGSPKKAFKVNTKAKISFAVSNVPSGASGIVHIVDTANVNSLPDSAMKTVNFTFSQLVSGSAVDSTTIVLGAGNVSGHNRRIVAVGFLQDAAGNLSSTSATDIVPVGLTDVNMHVLDLNPPVITPLIPKTGASDSTYFTGRIDTTLKIVPTAGGAAADIKFAATPLEFKSSEGLKSAKATFGDSTLTLVGVPDSIKSGSLSSKFSTDFGITAQGGKKASLKIVGTDSAGNSGDVTQADVWYDQTPPGAVAGSLFPTRTDAPPDVGNADSPTVNRDTMMPILQLLEATDSLAAQYVEVTSGTPQKAKHELAPGDPFLAITDTEIKIVFADTIGSNRDYTLQLLFRDLAGNHQATAPDTLTFDADFQNPVADSFVVAASDVIVIAAQSFLLDITGIDTALSFSSKQDRAAVTHTGAATVRLDAGEQDISGISYSGTGVTDNGDGTASLNANGWSLGKRTVHLQSTKTMSAFTAYVEDKTVDDVNFGGHLDSLQVDASNLSKYNVWVVEDADGGDSATGVSGGFKVMVEPADEYGNPSTKTYVSGTAIPSRSDSTNLTDAKTDSSQVLGEIFVEFSSNNGDVTVPQGPQAVTSAGSMFTVGGSSTSGTGLTISVRTVAASGDTVSAAANAGTDHDFAIGSTPALAFAPEGEGPPVVVGDLAAPANLIVADWLGSDGNGDQGGFVSVAFPKAEGASRYRIFREMSVSVGLGEDGSVVALDAPVSSWVSWTAVDNIAADDVQIAIVPTLDNVATNWAVASEAGGSSSERTASKRVFTKQIVQNMVQYFGVDPNRVLSMTELEQAYTPSQDYVKSIIGDRTDVTFAVIDPDLTTMLGGAKTVPQNIRTQSSGVSTSARTATETPVKAVDNIPPAALTELAEVVESGTVTLSWTASVDDHIVAYSSYKGYAVPIAGVDRYDVYRGESEEALELIGSVAGGVTTFTDADLGALSSVIYRVDASDLDNATPAPAISVSLGGRIVASNEAGPVYLISDDNFTVDFTDFIAFAGSFNLSAGEAGFVVNADTDDSGSVDFTDFLNFAGSFNQTATTVNGSPVGSTKPVIRMLRPGVNDNVELGLNLSSDKVIAGQTVTLNVTVANAESLKGFGFGLSYDTDKFEFVEATPASEDLLKSGGAETPVFMMNLVTPGELSVANAVVDGSPVTGNGDVVSLTFRVLTEFEDNARFEIAKGVVFDGSQLSNPVVALGSLNVESTPTEFALLQNFPNPFNPETTIKYNVAEGGNVSLRIYNVVGQVVRTLVAEQQSAGRYTVRWSGNDDRGVSVSSGIYFYQITAEGFADVKKLMLLK